MISGDDIKQIKLQLAPASVVIGWSHGEITQSETINYRTHKPERGGLYAEEIFGPESDYECACGKYKGKKYEGITCEKCHVLVTDSSVRRVNMGHISLASPVIHFWFLKGVSSLLNRLLGMKKKELQRIAYYETEPSEQMLYVVTTSKCKEIHCGETLYESEYAILVNAFPFSVEPAYYVEDAPRVLADEGGKVMIEERHLTNGEKMTAVVVGSQEYPIIGDIELLVEEGDKVLAETVIAERPVDEVCSETGFEMLSARYGEAIKGEKIMEFVDSLTFLVTRVKDPEVPLKIGDRLTYLEKRAYERVYPDGFVAMTGAAGIKGLLKSLDLDELHRSLNDELQNNVAAGNRRRLIRRLEVVDQLRGSGNNPQDMVLDVVPVLPPSLRPMIQLEGGRFATTDVNDLYRRIINRNNRLKKLIDMGAPEVILRNERRMLQEAVDALIHNEKKETPIRGRDNRPLKSLSERLHGKHGRLRRNLLGRRVDYSGRAVIVVDPKLKLGQCGLPKKMALELFKPFILHNLESTTFSDFDEIKNKALRGKMPEVWDILEKLMKTHPVLLNRAPTLHRLSIQAFEPLLVDGQAIHIHPLVCQPYNADFDGDQMAVHLPLSPEAITEARELMAAPRNILSPANGEPITLPTQDPVFAYYYLTVVDPDGKGTGKSFRDMVEARRASEEEIIDLHSRVKIRINGRIVDTTLGRAEMNLCLPEEMRNYDRVVDRSVIKNIVKECYHRFGWERTAELLDRLKDLGFEYATKAGLTISVKDCLIPEEKEGIIKRAYAIIRRINKLNELGLATEEERARTVVRIWRRTVDEVEAATMENLRRHPFNPLYGIVTSGARGGPDQVKQLCGMRGLMVGPSGEIIEMPVISNFREGLDMMEYFISTHGGRKGAADTALKTANSGYLTRRLVDACSDIVVQKIDCGTAQGIEVNPLRFSKTEIMETIEERIYGRVTSRAIVDPATGEIMVDANQWITSEMSEQIGRLEAVLHLGREDDEARLIGAKSVEDVYDPKEKRVLLQADERITPRLIDALRAAKISKIRVRPQIVIRSPMTCETSKGVCQYCYGYDMSNHQPVEPGAAVGVIAAQSIGEPGTQLTMRTFHTGGVVGADITQGLPRAEELFEARKALKSVQSVLSPLDGYVKSISSTEKGTELVEIESNCRVIQIPAVLACAEPGEEVGIDGVIDMKSPCSGEVYILDDKEMFVIDSASGDRSYPLPPNALPRVKNGEIVSAGDALTKRFNIEGIVSNTTGTVSVINEDERAFQVVAANGDVQDYSIPYGARMMVEPGVKVKVGDQLTSRSRPIFIAAEGGGTIVLLADRIIVYNPDGNAVRFPLTKDISPIKKRKNGSQVKVGWPLVQLEILHQGALFVEKVEAKGEITNVHLRPRSVVEVDQSLVVRVGDKVEEGDLLTKGVVAPQALLETAGVQKTRDYLLTEIHKVYKTQGVDINDKHLEIIIRQTVNNARILAQGDSRFLVNDLVTLEEFQHEVRRLNEVNRLMDRTCKGVIGEEMAESIIAHGQLIAGRGDPFTKEVLQAAQRAEVSSVYIQKEGKSMEIPIKNKELPVAERELLRISKAALHTKGWLSAASFQRTTKVLAEAALRGEVDELLSLKPSIIVGKRIPTGTGFRMPHEKTDESEQ